MTESRKKPTETIWIWGKTSNGRRKVSNALQVQRDEWNARVLRSMYTSPRVLGLSSCLLLNMIKLTLSVEEILNPTDVLSKYSDVFDYWKEVKDKPARTPNVVLWLRRIIKCLIELHFCSYKHVFQRLISFIVYDRRSFKNCFQRRLIFYYTPVCHQCLFKILYRWVIHCNERQ